MVGPGAVFLMAAIEIPVAIRVQIERVHLMANSRGVSQDETRGEKLIGVLVCSLNFDAFIVYIFRRVS